MANQKQAQKSHYNHPEEDEQDLDANVWISQLQRLLDGLPQGKQKTQHVHVRALWDPDYFNRLDNDEKGAAEDIRNVSLPRSRGGSHRQIGDRPAGPAWADPHKGTGFDPMPNKHGWKVR